MTAKKRPGDKDGASRAISPRKRKSRKCTPQEPVTLYIAPSAASDITRLMIWATYPGYADGSVQPPPMDARELAGLVRAMFAENARLGANTETQAAQHIECKRLRTDLEAYRRKLVKLREELSKLRPGPWEAEYTEAGEDDWRDAEPPVVLPEETSALPESGGLRVFQFPEDAYSQR